ncbi:MAG TPA: hypothetical protein VH682_20290, partial [Gemmataceae bacterium]
ELGGVSGLTCKSFVNMYVQNNATLQIGPVVTNPSSGYSTVHEQGIILVGTSSGAGTLNLIEDSTDGRAGTLITQDGNSNVAKILVDLGSLNLKDPSGSNVKMTIDIPVEVGMSTGVMNATQGGSWFFTSEQGTIADVELNSQGASLNLANNVFLEFKDSIVCDAQAMNNPVVNVTDNSTGCTLQTDGTITSVLQDLKFTSASGFAGLEYGGKMQIQGTCFYRVAGNADSNDVLQPLANATLDISVGTVNVTAEGTISGKPTWTLINQAAGSTITFNAQTGDWKKDTDIPPLTKIDDSLMPFSWRMMGTQ